MGRDLILMAFALTTWGIGEGAFIGFQSLYLQELGADPLRIGTIIGSYGLAASLAHIPAGYLSDRLGRRPLLWAAWLFGALAAWIMALANTLPVFVAGMLLYSMTMFVIAPMNSYVTAARGKWSVGRVLTLISATYNTGAILGPFLGGMIGERYGYQKIFLFAACVFILSTLIILFIRPQPVDAPVAEEKGKHLMRNSRYLYFVFAYFLATFAMYLPQPLSPNFLQNQRDLGLGQIGQLYSISSMGIVVLNLLLGQLNARIGYLVGQVAVGIFALLLWQGDGFLAYSLAFFLLGGFRVARSLATAHIRSVVSQSNMGLAFGLAETLTAFSLLIAPLLAGYLYDRDPGQIYMVSLGIIGVSLLVNSALSAGSQSSVKIEEGYSTFET